MKQYNAQLKYVGARPRRDKKLGKGGSAVIAGSATPTGGVSKSYIDSNFVTLATEQAISGRKNFVGGVEVNGQELVYDAEKKVWQLTGDLVVTGAVTMFGSLSGFTPSTVMDAVQVDGTTIVKNAQGQLTVIGGGGSGSVNESTVNNLIYEYLTKNNYAKISDISSALTGYATQTWVRNNYLSLSGGSLLGGVTITAGNLIVSQGDTVVGNLYPTSDASVDLGQGVRRWKNIYLGGYLTWGNSVDMTDIGDWNALKGNYGLRIISSTTTDSGAPYTYATALHIKGRYGFELAVQGGDIDSFAIRSITHNREWKEIIHSGNYTDYFTKANIKSTLGISDWALAATLEWSAVNNRPTKLSQFTDDVVEGAYLPLAGGQMGGNKGIQWAVNTHSWDDAAVGLIGISTANETYNYFAGLSYRGYYGFQIRCYGGDAITTQVRGYNNGWKSWYTIIHSGNIGQQSVNYATSAGVADSANEAYRFRTLASVVNQLIDLNTECLGGGLVRNYAGPSYWKNAPDGLSYGMVLTFASGFSSTLQGQLAWDVNHASTVDTTRNLWWRANDQTDFANSKWHQIAFTDSNVASATKLQTARTIWGQSFDGTGNVSGDIQTDNIIPTASGSYTLGTADNQWYAIYSIRLHSRAGSDLYIGANDSNNIVIRKNGNVAIGSTTADELLHVHGITKATLFKSVQGYTFPSSTAVYCGLVPNSAITSGGNSSDFWLYNTTDIKYQATNHLFLGGNVAIGGTTADAKLHVHGDTRVDGNIDLYGGLVMGGAYTAIISNNELYIGSIYHDTVWGGTTHRFIANDGSTVMSIDTNGNTTISGDFLANGAITMFSQLSMKNVIDYDGLSLEQLAQIRPARFTWKDGRDTLVHAGGIADDVMRVLPEVVHRTSDDKLTMDYGSAAFYIGASLIKPVIDHERRIADLERENKQLKQQFRVA